MFHCDVSFWGGSGIFFEDDDSTNGKLVVWGTVVWIPFVVSCSQLSFMEFYYVR